MDNLKEMQLTAYYQSVVAREENVAVKRLLSASESKGKPGITCWPALCAIMVMIGAVCTGSVEEGLNLQPVFLEVSEGGNARAENYTFGDERVFIRTAPKKASLTPDYQRVLEGCAPEDSLEHFILHLYQFVEPKRKAMFCRAAEAAFDTKIPADM